MSIKKLTCLFGFMAAIAGSQLDAAQWYVAANATSGGNGTITNPWQLQTALNSSSVSPGDIVWLRGGTYFPTATYPTFNINPLGWSDAVIGAANKLITFSSYSNEWAAIDREWGGIQSYICFSNLEFYDSLKGHNLTNSQYVNGPWAHFPMGDSLGDQWVNCVIHDVDNCFSGGTGWSATGQVRGCVIWYVGWNNYEHVCYPAPAIFSGNISAWHIQNCINNTTANLVCSSNIMFGGGQTAGETSCDIEISPGYNTTIVGNYCYNQLANNNPCTGMSISASATVISNDIVAPSPVLLVGASGDSISFIGNTVYANSPAYAGSVVNGTTSGLWACDSNYYCCTPGTPLSPNTSVSFIDNGAYHFTYAMWKSANSGFDVHSTNGNTGFPPNSVNVIPNQDQPKRCNIAIYNWSLQSSVTVNLGNILNAGDSYSLYSAQNYNGGAVSGPVAIQTGIFNGTNISVPVTGLTTAPILYGTNVNYSGESFVQPPPSSPQFAAFVVIGAAATNAAPLPPTDLHIVSP